MKNYLSHALISASVLFALSGGGSSALAGGLEDPKQKASKVVIDSLVNEYSRHHGRTPDDLDSLVASQMTYWKQVPSTLEDISIFEFFYGLVSPHNRVVVIVTPDSVFSLGGIDRIDTILTGVQIDTLRIVDIPEVVRLFNGLIRLKADQREFGDRELLDMLLTTIELTRHLSFSGFKLLHSWREVFEISDWETVKSPSLHSKALCERIDNFLSNVPDSLMRYMGKPRVKRDEQGTPRFRIMFAQHDGWLITTQFSFQDGKLESDFIIPIGKYVY